MPMSILMRLEYTVINCGVFETHIRSLTLMLFGAKFEQMYYFF